MAIACDPVLAKCLSYLDRRANQLFQDYGPTYGGVLQDYWGTACLELLHSISEQQALDQTARGNHDYGLDGYYLDEESGELYLYQFKYSDDCSLFRESMQRLKQAGLAKIFARTPLDLKENELLTPLREEMERRKHGIRNVSFRFVYNGDPTKPTQSLILKELAEQMGDEKGHLIEEYFGRSVNFEIGYPPLPEQKRPVRRPSSGTFTIDVGGDLRTEGPNGEVMHAGLLSLRALLEMFERMGPRLFDRNVRAPLTRRDGGNRSTVNKSIFESLKAMVIEESMEPSKFSFVHNGATMYVAGLTGANGTYKITEPRILNGAQTLSTLVQFAESYRDNPRFLQNRQVLESAKIFCKIIVNAEPEFVHQVTVSTNRQNPISPANLRANDRIQLEIADWLRQQGNLFYERQENAAVWQDPDELAETGITAQNVIQMKRLAETFAISDGKLERARNMNELFDNDNQYNETFHEGRITQEIGNVVLCYKARTYCHNKLAQELAVGRTPFVDKAKTLLWALVCQGLLNQKDIRELADAYGGNVSVSGQFKERLLKIGMGQIKPTLLWLVQQPEFIHAYQEERYEFLRGDKAFDACMNRCLHQYGWRQTRLGRPHVAAKALRKAALQG